MPATVIVNARLVNEGRVTEGDLRIENGRIARIAAEIRPQIDGPDIGLKVETVGNAAAMRCVLVMAPVFLSCGTLKSTRMSTRLPLARPTGPVAV